MPAALRTYIALIALTLSLSTAVKAQEKIVSPVPWLGDNKISLVLPKGWKIIDRDPDRDWSDKVYSLEVQPPVASGAKTKVSITFEKWSDAQAIRNYFIPYPDTRSKAEWRGFTYEHRFRQRADPL